MGELIKRANFSTAKAKVCDEFMFSGQGYTVVP